MTTAAFLAPATPRDCRDVRWRGPCSTALTRRTSPAAHIRSDDMRTSRAKLALTLATFMVLASRATSTQAGCGCDKPPPPVAPIRPAFASPGGTVTLFDPRLIDGGQYKVRFKNDSGSATSLGIAQTKRDFGDG